jgi:hypothetical protein
MGEWGEGEDKKAKGYFLEVGADLRSNTSRKWVVRVSG